MRNKTFYVVVPVNGEFEPQLTAYTSNELTMFKYIQQWSKETQFDIYEFRGDNIVELSEEIQNTIQSQFEEDMIMDYLSCVNVDIQYIITQSHLMTQEQYVYSGEISPTIHSAIKVKCVWNIVKKYINDIEVKSFIDFILFKYLNRLIVSSECDIYEMDHSKRMELDLDETDSIMDVYDLNQLIYKFTFEEGNI